MTEDFKSVAETTEVANADTIDGSAASAVSLLTGIPEEELDELGGFSPDEKVSPTPYRADALAEAPNPDPITMERKIGAIRATITLQSGVIVAGGWAAGDSQALRRLVETLVQLLDNTTEANIKALRGNSNMNADNRDLRDQLVAALNEVNDLHLAREHWTDQTGRVGQLMAEVTTLRAQVATAVLGASITPGEAELLRAVHEAERGRLAEKARADAAEARVQELTEQLDTEAGWRTGAYDFVWRHAVDAAIAADQAVKEEAWKNAGRLLKLANMWISLLAAADFPPEAPRTEPT